jgi:hypothetical protein
MHDAARSVESARAELRRYRDLLTRELERVDRLIGDDVEGAAP